MNDTSQPKPTRAMRLIFEYEGDQVRLINQQPVEMGITGFDILGDRPSERRFRVSRSGRNRDPLDEALQGAGLGEVTGGTTGMGISNYQLIREDFVHHSQRVK